MSWLVNKLVWSITSLLLFPLPTTHTTLSSWKELEKEFLQLKADLWELQQEIEYHKHHPSGEPDDRFVPAMEGFAVSTVTSCAKLEALIGQMKSQVSWVM